MDRRRKDAGRGESRLEVSPRAPVVAQPGPSRPLCGRAQPSCPRPELMARRARGRVPPPWPAGLRAPAAGTLACSAPLPLPPLLRRALLLSFCFPPKRICCRSLCDVLLQLLGRRSGSARAARAHRFGLVAVVGPLGCLDSRHVLRPRVWPNSNSGVLLPLCFSSFVKTATHTFSPVPAGQDTLPMKTDRVT